MGLPRIEIAVGVIDGVNVDFYTPTVPYGVGTVRVYLNGQLLRDDCHTEIDPTSGHVQLDDAPRVGDVVQLFYVDEGPSAGTQSLSLGVCRIRGRIYVEAITGRIDDADVISGRLAPADVVQGRLTDVRLLGRLREYQPLRGKIEVCS